MGIGIDEVGEIAPTSSLKRRRCTPERMPRQNHGCQFSRPRLADRFAMASFRSLGAQATAIRLRLPWPELRNRRPSSSHRLFRVGRRMRRRCYKRDLCLENLNAFSYSKAFLAEERLSLEDILCSAHVEFLAQTPEWNSWRAIFRDCARGVNACAIERDLQPRKLAPC